MNDTNDWIVRVRSGEQKLMETLYVDSRDEFIRWGMARMRLKEDEMIEVYQEASLILYENIIERKLVELQSSIKTYLFGIGKNLIYKNFRVQKRNRLVDKEDNFLGTHFHGETDGGEDEKRIEEWSDLAMELLGTMEEPCRSILDMFYRKCEKLEVIAENLNYKSKDVVKTQKSRCLKALKGLMEKSLSEL